MCLLGPLQSNYTLVVHLLPVLQYYYKHKLLNYQYVKLFYDHFLVCPLNNDRTQLRYHQQNSNLSNYNTKNIQLLSSFNYVTFSFSCKANVDWSD